jgi:hypothetical protein
MAGQWQSFKLASAGINPFSGANKSSDLSAMAAEFPRVQVKRVYSIALGRKSAGIYWQQSHSYFPTTAQVGDAAFDMSVNQTVLETYFRNTAEHGAENCVDKDRVRE